jgi:ArsR family transcriptional regulator
MMVAAIDDETLVAETTAVLKALSEPNRLRIFATLMTGDSCNNELQDKLGLAPNLLSHHLRVLEKVGLVHSRRDQVDGRWIYYSVDRGSAARWQGWFAHFLDPARIQVRPVCGPEGQLPENQLIDISQITKNPRV